MQESLPFQIYFKNQIIRLTKADSIKRYLFLKKEKHDLDLMVQLLKISKMKKEYSADHLFQ